MLGLMGLTFILMVGVLFSPSVIADSSIPTDGNASKKTTYGEGSTYSEASIQASQYFKEGKIRLLDLWLTQQY